MQPPPETLIKSFSEEVSRRFRAESARSLFANTVSKDLIAISELVIATPTYQWTEPPPVMDGFAIQISMVPLPRFQMRRNGHYINLGPTQAGGVTISDLSALPIALIQDPLASCRIQITQRTLEELAYDHGQRPVRGLRPAFGVKDDILFGLSSAILRQSDIHGGQNQLFLGHAAMALFAHLAQTYGNMPVVEPARGGLAPWHLQRARDLMQVKLTEGVTITELAEACGLSVSYFARAFRRSTGMPAHKWLLKMRVERAKTLLLDRKMELSEIALECGFVDQSHFSRVFSLREGHSPGRWRRLHLE